MKSRQITVFYDFTEDAPNHFRTLWCDATGCDVCMLRFQCFTSRSYIDISFPKETKIDDIIKKLGVHTWRLRDGSSRFRENR